MAVLTDDQLDEIALLFRGDSAGVAEFKSSSVSKAGFRSGIQAIEDWYEGERATVKSDIDTAIPGPPISNTLAKKMGKAWMKWKWGLE